MPDQPDQPGQAIPSPTALLIVDPGGGVVGSYLPEDWELACTAADNAYGVVVPVTATYDGRPHQ